MLLALRQRVVASGGAGKASATDTGGRWPHGTLRADGAPFRVEYGQRPTSPRIGTPTAAFDLWDMGKVDRTQEPFVALNARWPSQALTVTRFRRPDNRRWQNGGTAPGRVSGGPFLLALRVKPQSLVKAGMPPPDRQGWTTYSYGYPLREVHWWDGGVVHKFAVTPLNHMPDAAVRLGIGGTLYAVILLETTDVTASPLRLFDGVRVRALKKFE